MARRKLRVDTAVTRSPDVAVSDEIPGKEVATGTSASNADQIGFDSDASSSVVPEPHSLERAIQHELLNHPDICFSSLVVRRFRDGICLQGVIEVEDEIPDVEALARDLSGLDRVMNHLVVRRQTADV